MMYNVIYDRQGSPVLHSPNCFCPSMGIVIAGKDTDIDIDHIDAPDAEQAILDYYADSISEKTLSPQRAMELMRLGHCVHAPEGIGRRGTIHFGEHLILSEKVIHAQSEREKSKEKPEKKRTTPRTGPLNVSSNSPATGSHAQCSHPATKSARAACRRARAKGSQ